MFFKSIFDEELAHMSYLVGCQRTGEAIVIDPARDLTPYFEIAKKEGLTISAAAETHIHADYLSGAVEFAAKHKVKLYLSDEGDQNWKYEYANQYDHELLKGGSVFKIGNVSFEVIHTPGHTPESISFLLTDVGGGADEPMGIFTGDFLFVGDVGRPDLLEKVTGSKGNSKLSAEQMYESLKKMKNLPDYLQVWPAHGAGSACGKSLGAVPVSTLGYEKKFNWAFNLTDKEEFVRTLLDGQTEPPSYFAEMKKLNKNGPTLAPKKELNEISVLSQLNTHKNVVIDTREAEDFQKNFVTGSINIPFNRSFTNWAGWIINYDEEIVLIVEKNNLKQVIHSLQSIGLDKVVAFMDPKVLHKENLNSYDQVTAKEAVKFIDQEGYLIVDVRRKDEWDAGHIDHAAHRSLGHLRETAKDLPKNKTIIVHCQSGVRSAIATSILIAEGINCPLNLTGGYAAWEKVNG